MDAKLVIAEYVSVGDLVVVGGRQKEGLGRTYQVRRIT